MGLSTEMAGNSEGRHKHLKKKDLKEGGEKKKLVFLAGTQE